MEPAKPLIALLPTLRVSTCKAELDLLQLQKLMELTAPWAGGRALEGLEQMVQASDPVLHLWDGDFLVAFGRATSDSVYRAVLWDVMVHPRYQGKGIGRFLVTTLLDHPQLRGVEKIYLFTTHQQGFYERLGFQKNSSTALVLVR
ncbi:GNAT family N-acetyltransferase [Anthocerotibacter panamensis]|uniref:GNAT family N-acetyltransferase n=1 Tax=Anthocerotibacter panamensis TaxID=2857077 RepID=UPI001C4043FE|nr:GNAT family N-acetyltransferase [Anthocerotibacter panamensis]